MRNDEIKVSAESKTDPEEVPQDILGRSQNHNVVPKEHVRKHGISAHLVTKQREIESKLKIFE